MTTAPLHPRLPSATAADSLGLYAWQSEALEAWRNAGHVGVVEAVTGAGKTRVGLAAVVEAVRRGKRVVIAVPTLELVAQWTDAVASVVDGSYVATTTGPRRDGWKVLVGTVHTLARSYPCGVLEAPLLIADECHRYGAPEFAKALDDAYEWRLGLTATFARNDEGDLRLARFFGGVVFSLWYDRALAEMIIAPFRVALVGVPLSPAERAEYDEQTDRMRQARTRLIARFGVAREPIGRFLQEVAALARDEGSAGTGTARSYLSAFSKRHRVLADTQAKYQALAVLGDVVARSAGTLVFTQTQDSAEMAASTIASTGQQATAVYSGLEKEERALRMGAFRDRHLTMLAAPRILDEGIDVPEADLGIIVAANRSRRQMIQRLGRVLRKKHDGRSARFVVLYATNTVEDPATLQDPTGFYTDCLPHAEASRTFAIDHEADDLLRFLWAPVPQPAPASQADRDRTPAPHTWRMDHADVTDGPDRLITAAGATADPVKDYLRQIGRVPLLSAEDEIDLACRIEAGLFAEELLRRPGIRASRPRDADELGWVVVDGRRAFDRLISSNLRLVVSIARHYTGRGLPFLDLIQDGNLGLIRAVEKFDYTTGNKFSTYATWWIRQAITRGLADQSRTIRYPVHIVEQVLPVLRAERRFAALHGRQPSEHELAAAADRDVDEVRRLRDLPRAAPVLADLVAFEEEGLSLERLQEAPIDDAIDRIHESGLVGSLLGVLDDRARQVLEMRHGFTTGEPMTLDEIGRRFGVTRERIRQIESKAIKQLQDVAAAEADREGDPAVDDRGQRVSRTPCAAVPALVSPWRRGASYPTPSPGGSVRGPRSAVVQLVLPSRSSETDTDLAQSHLDARTGDLICAVSTHGVDLPGDRWALAEATALRLAFDRAAGSPADRRRVPPVLVFSESSPGSVRFEGVAVPKVARGQSGDNLVELEADVDDIPIRYLRGRFRFLPVEVVSAAWLEDLRFGRRYSRHAPPAWEAWVRAPR